MKAFEDYIGDGVYVKWDGYYLYIAANDKVGGAYANRTILFEPETLAALERVLKRIKAMQNNS